ncbi:MAG: group II intron reverse transcriptase domain-containing protein [Saprospiraceae bacterium]|nr:group II intron reverse transcriptase domain-containing protein [Saprospiraceae bacterium]
MKTHKNLWPAITDFQNLLLAAQKAQRGKRFQPNVGRFNVELERNLFALKAELETRTYQPGPYRAFHILDPKPRMISAAPYRDRVVHHALCNVIAPILEGSMIADTYANRKGKGTHKAANRFQAYCLKYPFVLKCDVKKFFPSIDHQILKRELRRKIGCRNTLWLIDLIIDNSNPQEEHIAYFPGDDMTPLLVGEGLRRRGLPIGNLTSQLWGNFYLNRLDHFVRETLGMPYLRYVDDFVVFGHSKEELWEVKKAIEVFLQDFRLLLHERKSRVYRTSEGVTFLGFRIFPHFRLLPSSNVRRFRKRTRRRIAAFFKEKITLEEFHRGLRGWEGHALQANTWRLRRKLNREIFE